MKTNYTNNMLPSKRNENASVDTNNSDHVRKNIVLRHMFKLNIMCKRVRSVNVTSDNRYLIITFENRPKIRVVDLQKLEFLPYKFCGHTDSVRLTSITKDNKAFYTASWDGSFRKFDLASGKCDQILNGLGRSPSCYLDPEQKYLFTASYDSDYDMESVNTGRCWDISSGKVMHLYKHTSKRKNIECIDIAYDQEFVYTGSDDGFAYKWKFSEEKPHMKYFEFDGSVRKVAVSDNFFAAACTDGLVRIHNKFTGEYFKYLFHGETDVREVRISKDETKLWSAAEDGSISCFNLMTGEQIYHQKLHNLWIWSICLMNDDKILVTGSGDGSIAFIYANTGQILARLVNLPQDNEFLIICPPDKVFPNGFFYTNNTDFIEVFMEDRTNPIRNDLELDDPRRKAYIEKLNLKNLVITRLKKNAYYNSLANKHIQNQKMLHKANTQKIPQMLKV